MKKTAKSPKTETFGALHSTTMPNPLKAQVVESWPGIVWPAMSCTPDNDSQVAKIIVKDFMKGLNNVSGTVKRGAIRLYIIDLLDAAKYTRKEIISMARKEFPACKPSVASLYIGHGMNGKGSDAKRLPFRVVEINNILSFDKTQPAGSWGQK